MRVIRGSLMIAGSSTEMLTKKKNSLSAYSLILLFINVLSILWKKNVQSRATAAYRFNASHISGKKKSKL